jgi:hypothetical protein
VAAAACPAGSIQVCEAANECPSGQNCMPAKGKGGEFGLCQ